MKKRIEVKVEPGETVACPNCGGTGDDPETMICCLCGGDGVLDNDEDETVIYALLQGSAWAEKGYKETGR